MSLVESWFNVTELGWENQFSARQILVKWALAAECLGGRDPNRVTSVGSLGPGRDRSCGNRPVRPTQPQRIEHQ